MIFFSSLFLWAGLAVTIPIAIALWNLKKHRREDFGAYFLLRKFIESSKKRVRLIELIKLLNRIALFSLLILVFAEPYRIENRLSEAGNGFAILVDVGRAMQSGNLIEQESAKVLNLLNQMPSSAQGSILYVSDHCELAKYSDGNRTTATADQWKSVWSLSSVPYSNSLTSDQGLAQCLSRAETFFNGKSIYEVFVSPLPDSLSEKTFENRKFEVEALAADGPQPKDDHLQVEQQLKGDQVKMVFSPTTSRDAKLIRGNGAVEPLGQVGSSVDLIASTATWLYLDSSGADLTDPWAGKTIIPIAEQVSHQIIVWAQKETPGFLSLVTALRNNPEVKIIREVGGVPSGDPVIIYGNFPYAAESVNRAWFFINPEGESPFKVRDKKQWTAGASSPDLQRAFRFNSEDGKIFIKRYVILDLDRFETLEAFDDGAPSLLRNRDSVARQWISPFDLEDLTTDLSLEPTFIPYLYRRLERWLAPEVSKKGTESAKPVWLLPGKTKPTETVLLHRDWPGIYGEEGRYQIVLPKKLPERFLKIGETQKPKSDRISEKVSRRPQIFRALVVSLFLELILCLLSARSFGLFVWIFLLPWLALAPVQPVSAEVVLRPIPVGVFPGIDPDRKTALSQFLHDASHLSNLDFQEPAEVKMDQLYRYAFIVGAGSNFGPFKREDRERIRDYCERGGLLIFDDPLAAADSHFHDAVGKELGEIFPGRVLKNISKDDVLTRTFYLLNEVSGRRLASPYLEGLDFDHRWVAIFSFNDLLGANLRGNNGDFAYSVSPYGISQRVLAKRLLLNLVMYGVTLDYKDDAIHLPHILKRRARQ